MTYTRQTEKMAAMLKLNKKQRDAVRGWMYQHGKPFEEAYNLVAKENKFPPFKG